MYFSLIYLNKIDWPVPPKKKKCSIIFLRGKYNNIIQALVQE